jgi:hypothetical protein
LSKSGHFSKANSLRNTPGEMLRAMSAASMAMVPEPHIGSMRSQSPFQPVIMIMPAASTSLRGASTLLLPVATAVKALTARVEAERGIVVGDVDVETDVGVAQR